MKHASIVLAFAVAAAAAHAVGPQRGGLYAGRCAKASSRADPAWLVRWSARPAP